MLLYLARPVTSGQNHNLELRVIEFSLEWLVALLMPARHVLETRSAQLSFMPLKDLVQSFTWVLRSPRRQTEPEGQVRCITAEFEQTGVNVAWNVSSSMCSFQPGWFRQCTTAFAGRKSNAATPGRSWG